jgi:hypothetical protein
MSSVRPAEDQDLARVLGIAARRRADYANYQPRFWRPAEDAESRQRAYLVSLLSDPESVFLVGCDSAGAVAAFVIARLVPSPPVYDPGGLTCFIDDFVVGDESDWPVMGADLIHAVKAWAAQRGGVQLVAVTGQRDLAKRDVLDSAGLSVASEWWVGEMDTR